MGGGGGEWMSGGEGQCWLMKGRHVVVKSTGSGGDEGRGDEGNGGGGHASLAQAVRQRRGRGGRSRKAVARTRGYLSDTGPRRSVCGQLQWGGQGVEMTEEEEAKVATVGQ